MIYNVGLYYPNIEIYDDSVFDTSINNSDAWLKNNILYWDEIRTMVPQSYTSYYESETAKFLKNTNPALLKPEFIKKNMDEVKELTDIVLRLCDSPEGKKIIQYHPNAYLSFLKIEKLELPKELMKHIEIDINNLPIEKRSYYKLIKKERGDDILVREDFANLYLTLLANRIAEAKGLGLFTDKEINNEYLLSKLGFESKKSIISHSSAGMLAQISIEKSKISANTPISDIIGFKEEHITELKNYRNALKLLSQVTSDVTSLKALKQSAEDIYNNTISIELNKLNESINSYFKKEYIEKIPIFEILSIGVAIPTTLYSALNNIPVLPIIAAEGIVIGSLYSFNMYYKNKINWLKKQPYSYLYEINACIGD